MHSSLHDWQPLLQAAPPPSSFSNLYVPSTMHPTYKVCKVAQKLYRLIAMHWKEEKQSNLIGLPGRPHRPSHTPATPSHTPPTPLLHPPCIYLEGRVSNMNYALDTNPSDTYHANGARWTLYKPATSPGLGTQMTPCHLPETLCLAFNR